MGAQILAYRQLMTSGAAPLKRMASGNATVVFKKSCSWGPSWSTRSRSLSSWRSRTGGPPSGILSPRTGSSINYGTPSSLSGHSNAQPIPSFKCHFEVSAVALRYRPGKWVACSRGTWVAAKCRQAPAGAGPDTSPSSACCPWRSRGCRRTPPAPRARTAQGAAGLRAPATAAAGWGAQMRRSTP